MDLVHQLCRAILNDAALLITDDVAVDSQRGPRIRVPQLALYDGWSCAVREQKPFGPDWRAIDS